jgi:beta-glucosidase
MYYTHNMTGRPSNNERLLQDIELEAGQTSLGNPSYYLDSGAAPLFPFGYGLSYTKFEYSAPSLDSSCYAADGTVEACVTLSNTGKYDAAEVVQLYVRDLVGSITRPVKELKGFAKTRLLQPGESETLRISIPCSELASWNEATHEWQVDNGTYTLQVGASSAEIRGKAKISL